MKLFNAQINNWQDWGRVFQSIPDFSLLVERILKKEGLPVAPLENLTPGTNAVFKTGSYVIKVYAPSESGIDQTLDQRTELFATQLAASKGVASPRLVADGFVDDRYRFAYIITEYISGTDFTEAVKSMTADEKYEVGRKLRIMTDKMNKPCEPFNGIDVVNDTDRHRRWNKYHESFRAERLNYIHSHDYGEKVFVHGDLCGDNILFTAEGKLYIIDFADAVLAPAVYEHALIAVELFGLDSPLLRGYFGDYSADELTDLCLNGLLIHDFGGDIVEQRIGNPDEFDSLEKLRASLFRRLLALLN